MDRSFRSPEEEIAFLREQIAEKQRMIEETSLRNEQTPAIISHEVQKLHKQPMDVLEKGHRMIESELMVASHDVREAGNQGVEQLVSIFETRGLKNALAVVEKVGNAHLEDDFHQYLVQLFLKNPGATAKVEQSVGKALTMTLFEISLPGTKHRGEEMRPLKEMLSTMEQFFAGMASLAKSGDGSYFSIEIANPHGTSEAIFYTAVPKEKAMLFEKHMLGMYPHARIIPAPQDYNIFNPDGAVAAGYGKPSKNAAFPIKTYDEFDHDPLNIILNTFSKLEAHSEGASIQLIIKPSDTFYQKEYQHAIKELEKGASVSYATDVKDTTGGHMWKMFKELVVTPKHLQTPKEKQNESFQPKEKTNEAQNAIEQIQKKIQSPISVSNIRIVASGPTEARAEQIYHDLESAFHQFENTNGNGITFVRAKKGELKQLERDYIFRNFSFEERFPLSLRELATLMHYADKHIQSAPHVKTSKANTAPAPMIVPQEGVTLGINTHRGTETIIRMDDEDRMRHMYVIGQTGTGKSTLIKNMAIQDIIRGRGVCFIDPHGVDVQDILASVPEDRWNDVIYFDPSYTARPMALNMLEYDVRYPEQKTFVVNEMLSIFNKLFDMQTAGGPMFEQYFRNATMLVIEDPDTGSTLFDVSRVLADKQYRAVKLSRCKNPVVVQFWREVAEKAGGEASLSNMVPYITSKFDVFLSNDIMRPIVAREQSSFNFRQIMDSKQILLVNLAKGKLGDINANLIGLIIVGKILMSALSRVDLIGQKMSDFYLYIDEFQNVTTSSISTILSEARKYRLSLSIAHQFIAQLDEKIRDAVFGNVGSMAAFRVGADDAEYLAKQYEPVFDAQDLMNIDNRHAYIKMLMNGQPVRPFNIHTLPPRETHPEILEQLKQRSYAKYGVPREEIEAAIARKYQKNTATPS